jgi:hypothetical protein
MAQSSSEKKSSSPLESAAFSRRTQIADIPGRPADQIDPRPPFGLNRTIPILGTLCFLGLFLLPYATAWMNSRSLWNEEDQRDDERGQNA